MLTIDTLGTPAIPHLRITHRVCQIKRSEVLPVEV